MRIFILKDCPYCQEAIQWITELYQEDQRYQHIPITYIDEQEEAALADTFDYYYVPAIYIGEVKVHEGELNKKRIQEILDAVKE